VLLFAFTLYACAHLFCLLAFLLAQKGRGGGGYRWQPVKWQLSPSTHIDSKRGTESERERERERKSAQIWNAKQTLQLSLKNERRSGSDSEQSDARNTPSA